MTIATGSSRIRRAWLVDPTGPLQIDTPVEEGVTNFAAVRTRTEHEWPETPRSARALMERYPWLNEGEEDDDDASPPLTIYAGTASVFGNGDHWTVIGRGDAHAGRRCHADPAWIIDALQYVADASCDEEPSEVIDGASCTHWRFVLDPNIQAGPLELPPHGGSRAPRIAGEVWIDDSCRIRRVTWTQLRRRRPRSPWKADPGRRAWQTVQLWEFGVAADIDVPEVKPDRTPLPIAFAQLAWELWCRKRAYTRRTQ